MARDNHPRTRQAFKLARKNKAKRGADRVLIVSEGEKTEPNYFEEIRKELKLPTANICAISSEYGTCPLNIVKYARDIFQRGDAERKIRAKEFEKVVVVFDRDEHIKYYDALNMVQKLNKSFKNDQGKLVQFEACVSIPCFELWLLIHYQEQHAPLHRREALTKLKSHIPDYEKGAETVYQITKQNIEVATNFANELAMKNNPWSEPEPYTSVHELVNFLLESKRR